MSDAKPRPRPRSPKERIARRANAARVLARPESANARFNALTALLGSAHERDELLENWNVLERWVMGCDRKAAAESLPLTPTDVVNRLRSLEDPTELLAEMGLDPSEAVALERLSAWFAAAARLFEPDSGDLIRHSLKDVAGRAREVADWARSGEPAADWAAMMLPFDLSERERMQALERITSRLGSRPIHPMRWRANRHAITSAADALGITVLELGKQVSWAAVHEAVAELTVRELRLGEDEAVKRFRRALERLVCAELLPSHDWARSAPRKEVPVDDTVLGSSDDPALDHVTGESPEQVWAAIQGLARLTPAEQALCDAFLRVAEDGGSWADAARELGIEQPAMRQRKSALLRKLRHAAGS